MREMGNEASVMGEGRMNQQTVCKSFVLFGEEFPLPKNTTAGRPPSVPFLNLYPCCHLPSGWCSEHNLQVARGEKFVGTQHNNKSLLTRGDLMQSWEIATTATD